MNRRSFFARTAGAMVAAIALSLKAPERVVEYRVNTTPYSDDELLATVDTFDEYTYSWKSVGYSFTVTE